MLDPTNITPETVVEEKVKQTEVVRHFSMNVPTGAKVFECDPDTLEVNEVKKRYSQETKANAMKYGNCLLYALWRYIRNGFTGRIVIIKSDSRAGFSTWYVHKGTAYLFAPAPKFNGHKWWFRGEVRQQKESLLNLYIQRNGTQGTEGSLQH